jgi:hypothetical protein
MCSIPRSATTRSGVTPSSRAFRPPTAATSRSRSPAGRRTLRVATSTGSTRYAYARLDVGTLSRELLSRTGQAPQPARAVEHALDLLTYANAKGLVTIASFTFNQPGETLSSAAETLDELQAFVDAAPNSSVFLQAQSWAFLPGVDAAADVETPAARFGTRIVRPEWWKEHVPAEAAAKEVVASHELAGLAAGDESYWRPRFDELHARLDAKLTSEARRGLRSHETVGSGASGVPHGWWVVARWH